MNENDFSKEFNIGNNRTTIVTLMEGGAPHILECNDSENLLQMLRRHKIYMNAACGGRGTCGKCKVQVVAGDIDISSSDRATFSQEQLQKGFRLACTAYPRSDCTINLIADPEDDFEVVAEHSLVKITSAENNRLEKECVPKYGIAIDIGTTTLAVSLINRIDRNTIFTYTAVNRQRAYGADVIGRIQASNQGQSDILQKIIQQDLLDGIKQVIEKSGIEKEQVSGLVMAGNTTMTHLLLGYSCKTLGSYPFIPVNIDMITLSFQEVFDSSYLNNTVIILPGISTFIGGDIVAGLLVNDFDKAVKPNLFLDLGTNGEMAVGNKDKILVTSTAAGPAFEGGNISCGVGSIPGAISNIALEENKLQYSTIGHKAPIGICGTGVIEAVSEFFKTGIVDETGLLAGCYFEDGYQVATDENGNAITLIQKDIREIQMAKAAVRAGIEILIRRYGISFEDIGSVFLAGGFGYKMNIGKAIHIGLLPVELSDKIEIVGNSSLGGAVKFLLEEGASDRMKQIIRKSSEIHLSKDEDFNDLYIGYLNF